MAGRAGHLNGHRPRFGPGHRRDSTLRRSWWLTAQEGHLRMRLKLTNSYPRRRAARYLLALTAVAVPAAVIAGPAGATTNADTPNAPRPAAAMSVQANTAHAAPAGSRTFGGL